MMTFDIQDVREFTAEVNRRLDACDHGEGNECASLDAWLFRYADECLKFYESAREWGRNVFSGRIPRDPEVERMWIEEGNRLFLRARRMWSDGVMAEIPCFELKGRNSLHASLWRLQQLLSQWVSPKLSVGPAARLAVSEGNRKRMIQRVAELTPLPQGWEPEDQKQRSIFRKIRP